LTTLQASFEHIFIAHAQKRPFMNLRSKIWPRHSLRQPRFPIWQMHFRYRVTFMEYFLGFLLLRRVTLWPWTLTFWPWECFMYSASHVRPTYQLLLSYDNRLL